jgi:uncharacterized protein (DUF1778 family)
MMSVSSPILSVRVTLAEREILEAAAEQAHTSLSDFVRRRAIEAAEMDVLGRTITSIPAADWEMFEQWLAAPAKDVPALRTLAASPSVWED